MADDEGRREDARIEAAIDRALKYGTMGFCWFCDDLTSRHGAEDAYFDFWVCKKCKDRETED